MVYTKTMKMLVYSQIFWESDEAFMQLFLAILIPKSAGYDRTRESFGGECFNDWGEVGKIGVNRLAKERFMDGL